MKFYILSDLHCEFFENMESISLNPSHDVDAVIVAGDIHSGHKVANYLLNAFKERPDLPIIYVAGNHEHYGTGLPIGEMLEVMHQQARDARESGRPLYFLENEEVVLNLRGESVCFLGCTLWTDMALLGKTEDAEAYAERNISDFRYIQVEDGGAIRDLKAADTVRMHEESVRFLESHLNNRTKKHVFDKTVVVTHYLPSAKSIAPRYASDLLNIAFASNLDYLLKTGSANLWVHGHVHSMCEYVVDGKTWVVCNPHGNPHGYGEQGGYVKDLEIEI